MNITEDGRRYLSASHTRGARPFHYRWLLPKLLGENVERWKWCTRVSLALLAPLAWWYTGSPWMMACLLLPWGTFLWRHPVLVDAPAMALALSAACIFPHCWPLALAIVLVSSMVKEQTPLFAAAFAWHPLLLLGLLPAAIRHLQKPGEDVLGPEIAYVLAHPLIAARQARAENGGEWRNPYVLLLPWGGLLVGPLAMTPQLFVALALSYGLLVMVSDRTRIFQWAWPALALAAVHAAPAWLPLVALSIVFNPYQGVET